MGEGINNQLYNMNERSKEILGISDDR